MDIIGHTERVDFPQQAIAQVPAKVDTGADSSSVWATNIFQKGDTLTFTLFGPESAHFTGEQISTQDYRKTIVRNSFGSEEVRYKVPLPIVIRGKTIRAQFTLSDRSRNRYPILLGKTTLHNNFLVDVSQSSSADTKRILVLVKKQAAPAERLIASLQKRFGKKADIVLRQFTDLHITIDNKGIQVVDVVDNQPLDTYHFVYFRSYANYVSLAHVVAEYLSQHHVNFIDTEARQHYSDTKLNQYALMAGVVPIPKTIYMDPARLQHAYDVLAEGLGVPFVLKDMAAQRGNNNFLIHSAQEFNNVWQQYNQADYPRFLAQQYIANNADLRLLVFHDTVAFALERTAEDTYLHNTSKGAEATIIDVEAIDDTLKIQAVKAAGLMHRQVAGVDFIQDSKSKQWYILEVNKAPQISSGTFVEEKMTAFGAFLEAYLQQLENKGQI